MGTVSNAHIFDILFFYKNLLVWVFYLLNYKSFYEDISTTDITIPHILIQGSITRSRTHQLKQQVNSFLCSSSCENGNRLLLNDVLVLRNLGEDQQGLGKGRGVKGEQLGRPHRAGAQANSTSTPPRNPGAGRTKIDAQDAYRLRFGRSIYGWKENFLEFSMAPVPYQTSI